MAAAGGHSRRRVSSGAGFAARCSRCSASRAGNDHRASPSRSASCGRKRKMRSPVSARPGGHVGCTGTPAADWPRRPAGAAASRPALAAARRAATGAARRRRSGRRRDARPTDPDRPPRRIVGANAAATEFVGSVPSRATSPGRCATRISGGGRCDAARRAGAQRRVQPYGAGRTGAAGASRAQSRGRRSTAQWRS